MPDTTHHKNFISVSGEKPNVDYKKSDLQDEPDLEVYSRVKDVSLHVFSQAEASVFIVFLKK